MINKAIAFILSLENCVWSNGIKLMSSSSIEIESGAKGFCKEFDVTTYP